MAAAADAEQWHDISYEYLGPRGDFYARRYYLDYPLLFLNIFHAGQPRTPGLGKPVLRFMDPVAMPVSGSPSVFVVRCTEGTTAVLMIDAVASTIDCSGVDGLSYAFGARQIAPTDATPASVTVLRPKRFVF
jgi:hypothetical protein